MKSPDAEAVCTTKDSPETDHNNLKNRLDAILSRQLDPCNFETFADDALNDLIDLVGEITSRFRLESDEPIDKATEDELLVDAGFDPNTIEATLDHIATVADSIKRLDALVIKKTVPVDRVILHPEPRQHTDIVSGDGSFEKPKEMLPKLKTLLLLLEQGLDIDIESDDVAIATGVLRDNMMRGASYSAVEIISLNRLVLSCDEVGNATYVFDTELCAEYGIDDNFLCGQTKVELNELISEDSRLGERIAYSKHYVDCLAGALIRNVDEAGDKSAETAASARIDILKPNIPLAPEGYLSLKGIRNLTGKNVKSIHNAIDELMDELGEVGVYNFRNKITTGYSPPQIAMIIEHLDILYPKAPPRPEGYLSMKGIRDLTGRNVKSIQHAIDELKDELGEVGVYDFNNNKSATGYSPPQIAMIIEHLDILYPKAPPAPDGYVSANDIRKQYGLSGGFIQKVIDELKDVLGVVDVYRFGNQITVGYSPEQVNMIVEYLTRNRRTKIGKSTLSQAGRHT